VKAADLAVCRFILVQKAELLPFAYFKELVPRDLAQFVFLRSKIRAKDTSLALRAADAGGARVSRLGPFPDLLVVCRGLCLTHVFLLSDRSSKLESRLRVLWFWRGLSLNFPGSTRC
jgi:hypothetical protein